MVALQPFLDQNRPNEATLPADESPPIALLVLSARFGHYACGRWPVSG